MDPYQCTYCQSAITSLRMKCAECPDFTLCAQCFTCGAEAGMHRHNHRYQVIDDSIFTGKSVWTAVEEESLLDAMDMYSFGNWEAVAEHVKSKTAVECCEHYCTYFINGNIGRATFTREPSNKKKVTDHTTEKDVSSSNPPSSTVVDLTIQDQQELGYMPLRDEFDREYDNEAENLIHGLAFNCSDDDLDLAFTLLQVDVYRRRLRERERRKCLLKDYGVIQSSTSAGSKKLQMIRAKHSKDERDARDKMRVFSRFHRFADHEQIQLALQREKKVKSRIKDLIKYRRHGVKKIADCAVFEEARVQRELKKKLGTLSAGGKPVPPLLKKEKSEDSSIAALGSRLSANVKSQQTAPGYELLSLRKRSCAVQLD